MTISHSRFLKSNAIKAVLNGTVVEIFHQRPIQKTEKAWAQAEAAFARAKKQIHYGICRWIDNDEDRVGARVVKLPEGFCGVTTERDDDNLEVIGTLLKDNDGNYYIETDLEAVEQLRRAKEKEKMDAGRMAVGEYGSDSAAYLASLQQRDTPDGLFTRGHGLS